MVPPSTGSLCELRTCIRTPSTIGRRTCSIKSMMSKFAYVVFLIDAHRPVLSSQHFCEHAHSFFHSSIILWRAFAAGSGKQPKSGVMDAEQELREFQREYLDFLDDGVSIFILSVAEKPNFFVLSLISPPLRP